MSFIESDNERSAVQSDQVAAELKKAGRNGSALE
jgi:hypothetical protein